MYKCMCVCLSVICLSVCLYVCWFSSLSGETDANKDKIIQGTKGTAIACVHAYRAVTPLQYFQEQCLIPYCHPFTCILVKQ